MADAAVEFLLDNLKQLLLYQGHLITDAKSQVEKLESELRQFKPFLKNITKKRRKNRFFDELVMQIRDVVYEAEDIIDTFVTQAAEAKSMNYFKKIYKEPVDLLSIAKKVDGISFLLRKTKSELDFAMISVADGGPDDDNEAPVVREKNIVGLDEEARQLIKYLKEEKDGLDVISIIGMPGLGKTTLAGKIFHDPKIEYEFPTRIWVYISQEFTRKNIFLSILKELTKVSDDTSNKTETELAQIVSAHLQNEKFLIVMDDVWTIEDWTKLKIALPKSNKRGKILITSRHNEVGNYANCDRRPHPLRFLTQDESWLLLRFEVFGKPEFPSELEVYGRIIVDRCDKLPLAVVVIGGILAEKVLAADDNNAVINTWRNVSENVSKYIVVEDPTKRMEKVIALSYDKLPYHLKACFLYLGMFPEDFEIPAWKLTLMWIAEGFIQHKDGVSLEKTAQSYLNDLINRNLLRVEKRRRDGTVKTCRIHDMLRDFAITKGGSKRDNFLQEMKKSRDYFDPPVDCVKNFRRLCIHLNVMDFICLRPYGPRIRSFVCFSKEEINMPAENISAIPAAFKLLRVLEVKPIKFTKIPIDMYQLVHLRYISISYNLVILPQAFSKLWNIQTLIVDTTQRVLEIRADIWKMTQLRHLKTNAAATLPMTRTGGSMEGEMIQTLGTISPESCNKGVFNKARNVKKLGIRGRLALLMDAKTGSFDSFGKLINLEKLKLINDVFPSLPLDGQLQSLPPPYQFPPKLRSLTLADTFLEWSHMSVLGLLDNLEVLKLKDKAFTWVAVDMRFRKLEMLYIGRTDLKIWMASKHHFPRLRSLELRNCEDLHQVPIQLAEIPSFEILDLYRTKFAAPSAKNIRQKRVELGYKFKLSIFPSDE